MYIGYPWSILTFLFAFPSTQNFCFGQTVTLYKESFLSNDTQIEVEVDLQNCTDALPPHFIEGEIQCGKFECALFYDQPACAGNSVKIIPKGFVNDKWRLKDIKSVGPCHPRELERRGCTARSYNLDNGLNPVIELFSKENFQGHMSLMQLRPSSCHEIPLTLKDSVSSIRTKDVFNICLQMYSETNCSQGEVTFQGERRFFQSVGKNLTGLASLRKWGFQGKARSISLCKFGCKETENVSISRFALANKRPRFNYVTIFDERNSSGNAMHVILKQKCANLEGPWEGSAKSLILHQKCVILYTRFDCGDINSPFASSSPKQQIIVKEETYRKDGDDAVLCAKNCNLLQWQMEGELRSMGRCTSKSEPKPQPLIAIFVLAGFFSTGIIIASCVNRIVRSRDKKEKDLRVFQEQPAMS